jgi:hypothetical protein
MQRQILCVLLSVSILIGSSAGQSHPRFQFFKMKKGEGLVSLVVPASTTDKELTSLLRFIQSKVQSGRFAELGITQPTDKRYGKFGYGAGIISIYRGTKCANEQFIDDLGPCGYGEHEAASYQWGVNGDPRKDEALIREQTGDLQKAF